MAKRYGRVHRLLHLITLIQGGRGYNVAQLAEACGTTPRTIYRDLNMLEGAGVPCYFDPETRGYRIRSDFFLPPMDLTLEEALALLALAEQVGAKPQIPYLSPASKAVSKIRSRLPGVIRDRLTDLDDRIAIDLARTTPEGEDKDVHEHMRQAIAARRAVRCVYQGLRANSSADEPFLFCPYCLFFGQRAWYVVGHHAGRGEIRCLKLTRFLDVQPTSTPYAIPDDFSLKTYLGKAWRMIPDPEGRTHRVELHFDADFAETIAETHWHDTQEIEWLPDGGILFRCEVSGLNEIVWWILSMGPHCTARQPAELARMVRELAHATLANYPQAKPKQPGLTR